MSEIEFIGPDGMSEPISFVQMYSDGTPMVKTGGFQRIVDKAQTMVVRPSNLNVFVTAMFLHDAVTKAGGIVDNLILPYVPGARQDRSNPTGDVLFTAFSVAEMINLRDFRTVVILDPHSPVITQEINNVVVYPLSKVAEHLPRIYQGVIVPDGGAEDRAMEMAEALDLPIFYGGKHRDVSTGKLTGFTLEGLLNGPDGPGHYLVVDDICDGGGTFIGLGSEIIKQGATADLYVSHGIFSKGTNALLGYYDKIYTTDSRFINPRCHRDIEMIEVVKEMENYYGN